MAMVAHEDDSDGGDNLDDRPSWKGSNPGIFRRCDGLGV